MDFPLRFEKENSHLNDFGSAPSQDLSNDNQRKPELPYANYCEETHPKDLPDDISFGAGSKAPLILKSALKSDTSRMPGVAKTRRKLVGFAIDSHTSTASRTSAPLRKRLKILALDLDRLDDIPGIIFRSNNKQKIRRTWRLKSYIRFGIKDVARLNALHEQVSAEGTRADQAILKCLSSFKKDTGHEVACTMFTHPSEMNPHQKSPYQCQPKQAEYLPSIKMEENLESFPKHVHSGSHCYQCDIPTSGNALVGHLSDTFETLTISRFD